MAVYRAVSSFGSVICMVGHFHLLAGTRSTIGRYLGTYVNMPEYPLAKKRPELEKGKTGNEEKG